MVARGCEANRDPGHPVAAGRPSRLSSGNHEFDFTRDKSGRELSRRIGETLTLTSVRDDSGRVAEQAISGGGRTVNRRRYAYSGDGHLTGIDDELNGQRRFGLDPVGRVTAVTASGWVESYLYDTGVAIRPPLPGRTSTPVRSPGVPASTAAHESSAPAPTATNTTARDV